MAKPKLTHKRSRIVLNYNPRTGHFTWLISMGRQHKGTRAGTINVLGYRQIQIDGEIYLAARLAVFWMTGQWPKDVVDHINMQRNDDRWCNLREATHSQNAINRPNHKLCGFCYNN